MAAFIGQHGRPEFVKEPGLERFRFRQPSPRLFQVLKCVRVVSGFRACQCLLEKGYVQEIGVLLRTILEFLNDIDFIEEGIRQGQLTSTQQEMLDLFFEHDLQNSDELMKDHSKRPTIARKKVYPAIAKSLNPGNPDRMQRILKTLEDSYSGYVHGSYPHIMELYEGGTWQFRTDGMIDTPLVLTFFGVIARCSHSALNLFSELAHSGNLNELAIKLTNQRIKLETSPVYRN